MTDETVVDTTGLRLFEKFQGQWEQLHSKGEDNIIKAANALSKLNQIGQRNSKQLSALDAILVSRMSLPKLNEQIEDIENDLVLLQEYFVKIERALSTLKKKKEVTGAAREINDIQCRQMSRLRELQCISNVRKERLKAEHLKRVESIESERQQKLEERRQLLAKAFEEEKQRYLARKGPKVDE